MRHQVHPIVTLAAGEASQPLAKRLSVRLNRLVNTAITPVLDVKTIGLKMSRQAKHDQTIRSQAVQQNDGFSGCLVIHDDNIKGVRLLCKPSKSQATLIGSFLYAMLPACHDHIVLMKRVESITP
jgi:hypothetical protein